MKIICWNVNSIRSRMGILLQLINDSQPDILLLQETKCLDDKFPYLELDSYGYNVAVFGQKSYNGVAILSKGPIEDVSKGLPNLNDEQARYIECITTLNSITIRVASVYVPNGSDITSDKFVYKLAFLKALETHLSKLRTFEEISIIAGDYNVAPEENDVYNPKYLEGSIGFNINERRAMRSLINTGFYDTFRAIHPNLQEFSWWDYRANNFINNNGMRIDHMLASPEAMAKIQDAQILKYYRTLPKTSDHAPLLCELDFS